MVLQLHLSKGFSDDAAGWEAARAWSAVVQAVKDGAKFTNAFHQVEASVDVAAQEEAARRLAVRKAIEVDVRNEVMPIVTAAVRRDEASRIAAETIEALVAGTLRDPRITIAQEAAPVNEGDVTP